MTGRHAAGSGSCPACGHHRTRVVSSPRPQFVEQCTSCRSTFFHFGTSAAVSHNDQYTADAGYQRYLESANETGCTHRFDETIARLEVMLDDVDRPSVFDVGAGNGDFLAMARERGFQISGNEVSPPAIEASRARHGIELVLDDDLLSLAEGSPRFDAVTMWCVIAHVDDPEQLLRGARALLRPGGVLFFSTPRYCVIDRVAMILRRITFDGYRRVFDRRINAFHRRQYSRRGMEALLVREGFEPVSVRPAIGYGLRMAEYLRAIGVPHVVARPIAATLEVAARRGLLPRNILNVYARAR